MTDRSKALSALLTIREAAARLGVTEDEIRDRLSDGSLQKVRLVGLGVRVPATELQRLEQEARLAA